MNDVTARIAADGRGLPRRAILIDSRCEEIAGDGSPCRANLWTDGTCSVAWDHWDDSDEALIAASLRMAADPTTGWSVFRPAIRVAPYV